MRVSPSPDVVAHFRADRRYVAAVRAAAGGGADSDSDGAVAWRYRGSCCDADPETFFPAANGPYGPAFTVCLGCPVQDLCLLTALRDAETKGVWGGTTPGERRAMTQSWSADTGGAA